MKKLSILCLSIIFLFLSSCANRQEEIGIRDFSINNWSTGIGAIDENSLDVFNEQKFTFNFFLTSETGRLNEVKAIIPILSDNAMERIITNGLPQLQIKNDYIEIQWYAIADTNGLTKEQIIQELEPFITAINIILEDDTEHIIALI